MTSSSHLALAHSFHLRLPPDAPLNMSSTVLPQASSALAVSLGEGVGERPVLRACLCPSRHSEGCAYVLFQMRAFYSILCYSLSLLALLIHLLFDFFCPVLSAKRQAALGLVHSCIPSS